MAIVSSFLRLFKYPKPPAIQPVGPDLSKFAEGDRVLVDGKKLSGPLYTNHRLNLPRGHISHNDIIGKPSRAFIATNVGHKYQITYPNLDQYIALTPRKVTPVYASYASLIVSLLDIHVTPPTASNEHGPVLEILESGTGHGALTLHLARAVHAANPPAPFLPPPKRDHAPSATGEAASPDPTGTEGEMRAVWQAHRNSRRAIIHSVEVSPTYSAHAQKLIWQFRRGMYTPHIDFHVASVGDWITAELEARRHASSLFRSHTDAEPFLSYVILDMPACHLQIETVAPAMKDGALLVVFVPSVTQIGDCVRTIHDKGLPLHVEKVLELGEGISNGRVWDVRLARKRARANDSSQKKSPAASDGLQEGSSGTTEEDHEHSLQSAEAGEKTEDDPVMVCRPKVGRMMIGGGFIGLWRKMDLSR